MSWDELQKPTMKEIEGMIHWHNLGWKTAYDEVIDLAAQAIDATIDGLKYTR